MSQVKFTVYIVSSAERGLSWSDRKLHFLCILDLSDDGACKWVQSIC